MVLHVRIFMRCKDDAFGVIPYLLHRREKTDDIPMV